MEQTIIRSLLLITGSLIALTASADNPQVVKVKVDCPFEQHCNFSVTLRHADTGWDHYANRWEVVSPDGKVLATRTLWHPHVEEQPFTRSLDKVLVPVEFKRVIVRAHDSVHGYGPKGFEVTLPPR